MVAVRVVDEGLMLVLEREISRQKGRSDIMAVDNEILIRFQKVKERRELS